MKTLPFLNAKHVYDPYCVRDVRDRAYPTGIQADIALIFRFRGGKPRSTKKAIYTLDACVHMVYIYDMVRTEQTKVMDMRIRDIDPDLSRRFKALASLEGKSLRSKIIELMEREVEEKGGLTVGRN